RRATLLPAGHAVNAMSYLSMNREFLRGVKWCAKRLECVRLAGALARAEKREQARRTPSAAAPLHVLSGSWPQLTSTFWRCSLSMNRDFLRGAKWCAKRLECARLAGALARAEKERRVDDL